MGRPDWGGFGGRRGRLGLGQVGRLEVDGGSDMWAPHVGHRDLSTKAGQGSQSLIIRERFSDDKAGG
uniref:Uncharacterized protein n=1 Tax=Oryza sativa subsp. japonica TaxID=39947 RepID=Q6YWP2_ORYSJ|nr:hypothetical protein [Oryza sativa Japonica Group]BAD13257.1 hypothetical protein [Oryza sativa Japonica Group]